MRVKINLFFAIFACTTAYFSHSHAATPQPFSQYGMIQNVQNYSSNPFWNPHSPYNTRFPTAVYAKGPKIDTAECQTVVYNLVASVCVTQNNCVSMELSDIRPAVLLALSRMGQGNYATACGGYLDDAFEKFRTRTAQTGPVGQTAFPDATVPNTNADGVTIEYYNPFESQKPEWALDMKDRADELAALHAQTHPNADHITKAAFPATYADLSFEERIANEQAGYEPYQDKPVYQQIDIKASVLNKEPQGNNNNGGGGGGSNDDDGDEGNEEEQETPTGYTSKYYLLFDNGNYDEKFKNITEPTAFTQATSYKYWKDDCSQKEKNPHTSRILNDRDLNKTLKEIRKILGTTARTEYVLNQPHDSKTGEVYQINGLLLIAPNAQHDQRVVWNTTDKTKAYTVQEKIRDAFNQGTRTSCNDLRIYVLEHQIDNSTQEHKYIVHPTPVTISR